MLLRRPADDVSKPLMGVSLSSTAGKSRQTGVGRCCAALVGLVVLVTWTILLWRIGDQSRVGALPDGHLPDVPPTKGMIYCEIQGNDYIGPLEGGVDETVPGVDSSQACVSRTATEQPCCGIPAKNPPTSGPVLQPPTPKCNASTVRAMLRALPNAPGFTCCPGHFDCCGSGNDRTNTGRDTRPTNRGIPTRAGCNQDRTSQETQCRPFCLSNAPRGLRGSFEWKVSWAMRHGCRLQGSQSATEAWRWTTPWNDYNPLSAPAGQSAGSEPVQPMLCPETLQRQTAVQGRCNTPPTECACEASSFPWTDISKCAAAAL